MNNEGGESVMDFAILATKRGENFIVLYEGSYEHVVEIKDKLTDNQSDSESIILVRVDEKTYQEKKYYLEILNEYIESCIGEE